MAVRNLRKLGKDLMNSMSRFISATVLALVCLGAGESSAEVVITGTRVIYPGAQKEVSVQLSNKGQRPALVQVWVDDGTPSSGTTDSKTPFLLTPPLARMEGGKGQVIRIMQTQAQMPTDKESLFWFNMLEIPPKLTPEEGRNVMQYAVKTRIKLIYRPSGLPGDAIEAPSKVQWSIGESLAGGLVIKAHNPTPYYVNFASMGVQIDGGPVHAYPERSGRIAPGQTTTFDFKNLPTRTDSAIKIVLTALSDLGGAIYVNQEIKR